MLFLVLCVSLLGFVQGSEPLVQTSVGWIQGLRATDGDYNMFLGIPYATLNPENPFGHSTPHPGFTDIFQAFDDSAICPQIEEFNNTIVGDLDCLHLNIYVPHSASQVSGNRLPVLIWIYGGHFEIGFAGRFLYGPKYFVRHDIILVTMNYRVGPYGFMCLDIPEIPGNQGLKDQEIAFKWVKDNILAFGGDVDRITLMGESAGGMSIELHLLSDQEKIYNNVILQSGSSLRTQLLRDSNPDVPQKILQQLGYPTNDVYEAISILSSLDPREVIDAAYKIGVPYRPCVEKEFDGVRNILADYPINMDIPKVNGMNIMIGYTNQEMLAGLVNASPEVFENLNVFCDSINDGFDLDDVQMEETVKAIRQFYIGDEEMSPDVKWDIINFNSDIAFNYPAERSIQKFLEYKAGDIFYFVFSYNGGRNFVKNRLNITVGGAAHADEIGYLFDVSYMSTPTSEDQLVIDRMTTMWANFVKFNDPTPETSNLLPIKWMPITQNSRYYYLDIDSSLNLWRRPFHERMAFWDLFISSYGKYQKGYQERNTQ